jgi:HEPN domain-containing protein
MKPPDEVRRELVEQWVARAVEDLAVARHLLADDLPYYAAIGFHAQQAAEKLIKAFLVATQAEFPKTHDLGRLLDLVATVDAALAAELAPAIVLTDCGVDVRYPGDLPVLSVDDARQAVDTAGLVQAHVMPRLKAWPGRNAASVTGELTRALRPS